MTFNTTRDDIHGRYPGFSELVDQQFPDDTREPDAFQYALVFYLRSLPNEAINVISWETYIYNLILIYTSLVRLNKVILHSSQKIFR